jgi:hypothetical protein
VPLVPRADRLDRHGHREADARQLRARGLLPSVERRESLRDVPERGRLAALVSCPASHLDSARASGRAPCVLEAGHPGPHRDAYGDEWPRRLVSAADEYRASCRIQGKAMRSLATQVREAIDELALPLRRENAPASAADKAIAKLGGVERALLAIATHLETAGAE